MSAALLFATFAQADYQSGLDAFNDRQYKTAMYEWQTVLEQPQEKILPLVYAETHYAIGMLYWMGLGVKANYFTAAEWISKAADLGHAGAEGKMGFLYTEGITVEKNYETAFEWFQKAAKQGDIDGQYNLGIFYLNGWGTEKDKTMAAQYLGSAAAQGDRDAEIALSGILDSGDQPTVVEFDAVDMNVESSDVGGKTVDMNVESSDDVGWTFMSTDWILTQNPEHYTIQVIGLRSITGLENLVKGHETLTPFAIYTQQKSGKPLHLLIQGVYPDVESARAARDKFPSTIQKPKNVWIRQFKKIQELL